MTRQQLAEKNNKGHHLLYLLQRENVVKGASEENDVKWHVRSEIQKVAGMCSQTCNSQKLETALWMCVCKCVLSLRRTTRRVLCAMECTFAPSFFSSFVSSLNAHHFQVATTQMCQRHAYAHGTRKHCLSQRTLRLWRASTQVLPRSHTMTLSTYMFSSLQALTSKLAKVPSPQPTSNTLTFLLLPLPSLKIL